MTTIDRPSDPEADPRVKAVFDDIRTLRKTDTLNDLWHYLAFDPELLEQVWADVKQVMGQESALDSKTKEMIYVAVSIANNCRYCVHSHTEAAKAKGMTSAEHADLLRVVATASKTNALLNGMQIPVDVAFDTDNRG